MLKQTSPNELDVLVLLEAQALLERGWCQNALQISNSFCALGAINQAATGDPMTNDIERRDQAYIALSKAIGGASIGDVVDWNNALGRTQAEVVEAFGRAAAALRSRATMEASNG